jgi:hypothetical protein
MTKAEKILFKRENPPPKKTYENPTDILVEAMLTREIDFVNKIGSYETIGMCDPFTTKTSILETIAHS